MAHDVFISYSSKDKPIADAICANLERSGIRCWIAPRDIAPGEDWPTAIAQAIPRSHVMVLLFSASSNASEDVSRELFLAANSRITIIPFKIENVELEPGKQYYLARTHWLDAINPPTQEQIDALVERVRMLLPALEAAPAAHPLTEPAPAPSRPPRPAWAPFLWIPAALLTAVLLGWAFFSRAARNPAPLSTTPTSQAADLISAVSASTPAPGYFRIRNRLNPYCLASLGDSQVIDNPVVMGQCDSSNAIWHWNNWELHNERNPHCLASIGDSRDVGVQVGMGDCGMSNGAWEWHGEELQNGWNSYCLASASESQSLNNPVVMGPCGQPNATWYTEPVP
jgi:hypothetical protein